MTGVFICSAGLSYLMFENYAHEGGADFNLCSDNCSAGTEKYFFFSFPFPVPYKNRTASETIRV